MTVRNLAGLVVLMILMTCSAFSQDTDRHVIAVTATYTRADFNIKDISGEVRNLDASRDSPGFAFSYDYFPTNGPLTVGAEAGASFENRGFNEVYSCGSNCTAVSTGTSKVSKAYFQYQMGLAKRTGRFQPGAAAVIGVERSEFGGVSFVNDNFVRLGRGSSFYYGGNAYIDIKLKGPVHWRNKLQVTHGFNSDSTRLDVQVQTGLAFKF